MAKKTLKVIAVTESATFCNNAAPSQNRDIVVLSLADANAGILSQYTFAAKIYKLGAHAASLLVRDETGTILKEKSLQACKDFFVGKTEEMDVHEFSIAELSAASSTPCEMVMMANGQTLSMLTELGGDEATARARATARFVRSIAKGAFKPVQ